MVELSAPQDLTLLTSLFQAGALQKLGIEQAQPIQKQQLKLEIKNQAVDDDNIKVYQAFLIAGQPDRAFVY